MCASTRREEKLWTEWEEQLSAALTLTHTHTHTRVLIRLLLKKRPKKEFVRFGSKEIEFEFVAQ